jgi:hypothetical protein
MTRSLPRFALRRQHRSRCSRLLQFESLSDRLVLTGAVEVLVPSDLPLVECPAPAVSEAPAAEAAALVHLDAEGVMHVEPTSPDTEVVVREFLNYQLEHVVEVEVAGQWTAFAVDEVQQIQVHQGSDSPTVDVTDGVSVPVELAPASVDAVLAESDDSLLSPVSDAPALNLLSNSPAEGEESYAGPTNDRPVIEDFTAYEVGNGNWVISGRVVDDKSMADEEVELDGLVQASVSIDSNGYFSYITTFPAGTNGAVTAITTDIDDAESEMVYTWIIS